MLQAVGTVAARRAASWIYIYIYIYIIFLVHLGNAQGVCLSVSNFSVVCFHFHLRDRPFFHRFLAPFFSVFYFGVGGDCEGERAWPLPLDHPGRTSISGILTSPNFLTEIWQLSLCGLLEMLLIVPGHYSGF